VSIHGDSPNSLDDKKFCDDNQLSIFIVRFDNSVWQLDYYKPSTKFDICI